MKEKLLGIFCDVLGKSLHENEITNKNDAWDSLKHMNLVIALEEEFEMEFSESEIPAITNYRVIKEVILSNHLE